MKKIVAQIITLVILMGILFTGCEGLGYTTGSGNLENKQYDLKDFNKVEISNSFEFEIKQSSSYSVNVTCHENIIPYLDVFLSNDTLVVRLKAGFHTNGDLNAIIALPQLVRLDVSGASRGSARGFTSDSDLELRVSGASQLDAGMEAGACVIDISGLSKVTGNLIIKQTSLRVSGASRCELKGSAGNSDIEVSGASEASLKDFQLQNVDINVSGASTAIIKTDGILNLDISGASKLEYYGNPTLSKVSVTGASKISSKS